MTEGGKLIIFSAPSGSGKTTIVKHLLDQLELNLAFSISATSRPRRGKEKNGVNYYFMSVSQFKRHIKDGDFLEWEEVYRDNFYGTLKSEVERLWAEGKNVIFDIDVSGGLRIKKKFPEKTLAVFVKPPSVDELKIRLKKEVPKAMIKSICGLPRHPWSWPQPLSLIKSSRTTTSMLLLMRPIDWSPNLLGPRCPLKKIRT